MRSEHLSLNSFVKNGYYNMMREKKIKATDLSWNALDKIIVNAELKKHNFTKKVNTFLKKKK
ncbi:hypothetical protein FACS1894145_2450 [Bacteroidia bacterium]|nr:hypothetical protein FACS1894145_2450 [Bacteroidia bacterium]